MAIEFKRIIIKVMCDVSAIPFKKIERRVLQLKSRYPNTEIFIGFVIR